MKILIVGAGKMGSFICDLLSMDHDVAIIDTDPRKLLFTYNVRRFSSMEEVKDFAPELVVNAATVRYTLMAFERLLPYLPADCMLSDIASVKTGLKEFYEKSAHPYVSTHPMFGPTFASLSNLRNENAIIISEGDEEGRRFFRELYSRLELKISDFSFEEHDRTIAYSLSIPFASSFAFAGVMEPQSAPGTTFKRHLDIARGLMSEDDYLLSEIMFNPHSAEQLEKIRHKLEELQKIVEKRDADGMKAFLGDLREKVTKLG